MIKYYCVVYLVDGIHYRYRCIARSKTEAKMKCRDNMFVGNDDIVDCYEEQEENGMICELQVVTVNSFAKVKKILTFMKYQNRNAHYDVFYSMDDNYRIIKEYFIYYKPKQ